MYSNFYATAAQVLPVLLLALIWQTNPRVRVYAMTVVTVALASLMICLLVLAGLVPDSIGLRLAIIVGLALASGSLLYRMWNEIRDATSPGPDESPVPGEEE
jgi:Kef-type K+ transport system membrane component KefB